MLCRDEFNFGAKALVKEGMVGIKGEIAVQKNKNCVLEGIIRPVWELGIYCTDWITSIVSLKLEGHCVLKM